MSEENNRIGVDNTDADADGVRKMFFVYHGYCSADNYDASKGPTYKITECKSTADVAALKRDFDESIHDECSNVIFRVFEGVERRMKLKKG